MSKYLDERFAAFNPYTPGEQPQDQKYVKLNTNESPYPPSPEVLKAVGGEAARLNRYPDPTAASLKRAFADSFSLSPENIFVGNGSDEILAFCFQALCPDGATFADLTYGFYPVFSQLYGADYVTIALQEDFSLRPEDYAACGRTIFIANPNAPTGLALCRAEIEKVLATNPNNLVVVDEAYVDFGAESAVPLLNSHENLMVIGTFSKSRSMAGARLGYAAASATLVADLELIKYSFNPYNLNRMTMAAGMAALKDEAYFQECKDKIIWTRKETTQKLTEMGFTCTDSKANFIFARHPHVTGEHLYRELKRRGVLVRWFDKERVRDYLRITVGTDTEMAVLIQKLAEIIE